MIEKAELAQGRKEFLAADAVKKPTREQAIAMIKEIEKKKADTLSELSNPFKVAREKIETILDLEAAKNKITDYIEVDQGIGSESLFWAACHHYELMKTQQELNDPDREGLSRDA